MSREDWILSRVIRKREYISTTSCCVQHTVLMLADALFLHESRTTVSSVAWLV